MSTGNAEQPSAQTPNGPSSPSRIETAVQDRQEPGPHARQAVQENPERPHTEDQPKGNGSQTQKPNPPERPSAERPNPQEQKPAGQKAAAQGSGAMGKPPDQEHKNSNGQSNDGRAEQPAHVPAGPEAEAVARSKAGQQSPWTAAYAQHTAGRTSGGASDAPPGDPPKLGAPQQAQSASNQQESQPPAGGQTGAATSPKPDAATPPAPTERPAQNAIPVWDPPPLARPKQSLFGRLGLAKKSVPAETAADAGQREDDAAAPPASQAPAASTSAAPAPPTGAAAGTGSTAAMGTGAPQAGAPQAGTPQAGTPAQPKPAPEAEPPRPTGSGAGVGPPADLSAAGPGQVRPQAPTGPPSVPQPQGRGEDSTGRTPPVPGGGDTASGTAPVPAAAPQARMPAGPVDAATRMPPTPMHPAPMHPGAPRPFPIPAPVQALREANTVTGQSVPAQTAPTQAPGPVLPEAHHPAKSKVGVARRTRKARLRLSRLDPWSVMKTSFLFSIAAGIMLVVAVYSIWAVLSTSHLFDSINEIVRSVVSTPGDTTPFRIQEYINTQKVMGVSALIACVDVVIFTALATLGSFLYNLAATMLGGLEITLAED